jgi:alpha-mannosidase
MTWEGELYLELHNGTYTTMGEHKYYNRYMETLMRDIEIFYYLAELTQKEIHKPDLSHEDIKLMWYTFLIDQFHDVLPGTCTFMTVEDTR